MPEQLPEDLRDMVRQAQRTVDVLEVLDTDRVSFGCRFS
jgi:hypothetical protein